MANNFTIGVNFAGNLGNLPAQTAAAAAGLNNVGNAANTAGASLQRLPPAIAPAGRGLGQVGRDAIGAASALNRIPPASGPAAGGLNNTATAANAASASLARMRGGAQGGSAALTDFSRIVQDAPYGIIGIGNNITQLAESFGRLRATSGSTGAAFRQLFTSAGGFGGIGLAISLITTALTFASVGFGAWTKGLTGAKKVAEDAAKAAKEFAENLKSVNDVVGQSTGGVQGEIVRIQALASVVTNANNSYEQRKRALTELQQVNKSYFGDLKLEENQMGALTAKVNEYTKALINQAVVKGFETELGKVSTGLYDQEKQLKKTEDAYKRLRIELDATKQTTTSATGEERVTQRYVTLTKEVSKAKKAFEEQRDVVTKGRENFVLLQDAMSKAVVAGLDYADMTNTGTKVNKKETDALKQRIDALKELKDTIGLSTAQQREFVQLEIQLLKRDGVKLGFTQQEVQDRVDNLIRNTRFGEELKVSPITMPLIVRPRPVIDVSGATGTDVIAGDYAKKLTDTLNKKTQESFKAELDFGPAIATALGDTISAVGEGGDVFGTIFQSIGAGLKSLGTALIAYGVAAEAFKKTFSNPFAAIAAGAGLILAGSLLQRAIPKFADGVTNFSGGLALVGERGPELVNLPRGSDVIPNNQIGGYGNSTVKVEGVIYGRDIYLANQRQAKTNRRI